MSTIEDLTDALFAVRFDLETLDLVTMICDDQLPYNMPLLGGRR